MLGLSVLFFLLAIGAAILGFGGLAGTLTSVAVIAFFVFAALLVISLIAGAFSSASGNRMGAFGAVVAVILVAGVLYVWGENHGGTFNQDVKGITADATDAIKNTDAKAKEVVGDVAQDTRQAINDHKSKNSN